MKWKMITLKDGSERCKDCEEQRPLDGWDNVDDMEMMKGLKGRERERERDRINVLRKGIKK